MIKILNKKLKDSSRKWIARQVNDEFAKQKVVQGFRSRSAFKLLEIEKKFKIFKNNSHILDLGSSPGGWSQVLAQKIKKGKILAVDILPMKKINNVNFILGNFLNSNIQQKILGLLNHNIPGFLADKVKLLNGIIIFSIHYWSPSY